MMNVSFWAIAFDTPAGPKGMFGPILSRMPQGADGAELWGGRRHVGDPRRVRGA